MNWGSIAKLYTIPKPRYLFKKITGLGVLLENGYNDFTSFAVKKPDKCSDFNKIHFTKQTE